MKYIRYWLIAALILAHQTARAEWVKFSSNNFGTTYLIEPTTRKGGSFPRVWVWSIHDPPMANRVKSDKSLYEADCKAGRFRALTTTYYYDAEATREFLADDQPEEWQYPMPGSVAEHIYIYLCIKQP